MEACNQASIDSRRERGLRKQTFTKCQITSSEKNTKRFAPILLIILPIIAVSLVIYQIVISNELATLGKSLGQLDHELSVQNDIHETLVTEVASASSYMTMRTKAEVLGFVAPRKDQIVALSSAAPVALGVTLR